MKFGVNKERHMTIANERTSFKFVPLSLMFTPELNKEFREHIKKMTDEQFEKYIVAEFKKMGYDLKLKK